MKKLWKKQLPAAALALIMMISLVPAALAGDWQGGTNPGSCSHQNATSQVTQEATCSTPGIRTFTCTACNATKTESIPATNNHNYGSWYKLNDSQHQRRCSNSNCSATDNGNHTFSVLQYDAASHWYKCSSCEAIQSNTSHSFTKQDKDSSSHWMACATCGYKDPSSVGAHLDKDLNGACDTCSAPVHIHNYSTSWSKDGSQHWHQCSCGDKKDVAAHSDGNKDGYCDACSYQVGTYYSVNYYYLTTTGYYPTTNYKTYQVPVNGNAGSYAPPTPTVTVGGKTYTFKGWTTVPYSGSTGYLYTNQYLIPNIYSYPITNNTNFYAVYTTNDSATITYTVDPGKETSFDSRDFYNAYRNQASGTLSYVTFSLDRSTYNGFEGDIYLDNSVLSYSDLTNSRFYYDPGRNEYDLDDLSLVADKNDDDDSITLNFTAYGTSWGQQVSGTVKLVVGDEEVSGDTIPYKVAPGKTVDFDRRDFDTVFRNHYPSDTLGYVVFDRPDSDAFDHGTLYSEYGSSSRQVKFTRNDLDDAYFYYNGSYATGRSDYELDELTFVADSNFKETITLTFTAYALNNTSRYVEGEVRIRSTEAGITGDITYKVAPGKSYTVSRTDFLNFLRKSYSNETLEYVIFDKPDSSAFTNATLYSGYNTSKQVLFTRNDLNDAYFYYNASDATGRRDYALDSLTFVADSGFKEAGELSFTAYDDDSDYVTGTLVFQPDGAAAGTSNYVGSVRYAAAAGNNVQINANDLARYYQKATGGTLQYVTFTGAPSAGGLYYNYYGASKYGSPTRLQLTAGSSQSFYLNPTSTAQYALTELTYVPSGSNYCASIPFVAYGTNYASVSGAILISVSRSAVSEIYGTTLRNTAVSFPASGIYSAVLSATGSALYSIQLLSLPASNQGTVYVGSGTSNRANTTSQYTYASGVNAISQLRFVPAASYTGSVEIPYVALNSSGTAIASGVFSIGVVNTRRSYTDVTSSTWCYKYVTELADAGVISGYKDGSFKPASTISYGAALKLVMRAAGYPELAPTNKNSVFSGYLARAQADGLVTRSNINLAAPITRLQVAQLAAGALKLSTSNLSSVKPFTDTSDLYVQALNAAGIVEGYFSNGTSTFRPNSTLNRGQVSAIVWRMQNYRK